MFSLTSFIILLGPFTNLPTDRVLNESVFYWLCTATWNKRMNNGGFRLASLVIFSCLKSTFRFNCSSYCWRALARQLPILYNREKKPKSVGCKIGDLRSKFPFNIRGLLNVETCAVDYGCL